MTRSTLKYMQEKKPIDSNSFKLPNDLIKHVSSNVSIDIVLS